MRGSGWELLDSAGGVIAFAWREERGLKYRIEVDGGINFEKAAECAHAGADTFVSGTGLFGKRNLKAAVKKMREGTVQAAPSSRIRSHLYVNRSGS